MSSPTTINGQLVATDRRFALVVGRFNSFIVDQLVTGAIDTIVRHGGDAKNITIYRCPGGFELPLLAQRVARKGGVDGIIALGAVIRGSTPHFDNEATKGLAQVSLSSDIPIGFGLLTCDTIEQAIERAGTKAGNKGGDAALAAIEMIDVLAQVGV